jgi:hypothetical protein
MAFERRLEALNNNDGVPGTYRVVLQQTPLFPPSTSAIAIVLSKPSSRLPTLFSPT